MTKKSLEKAFSHQAAFSRGERNFLIDSIPAISGSHDYKDMLSLEMCGESVETGVFSIIDESIDENSACLTWRNNRNDMQVQSTWRIDDETNVISRRDKITNVSAQAIQIKRCMAKFVFAAGSYEIYSQASRWCNENQGRWQKIGSDVVTLKCETGRTTLGGTPYVFIRDMDSRNAAAIHILPVGNWKFKITPLPSSMLCVECGLSDETMNCTLNAGCTLELPEILLQFVSDGLPEEAAPNIQKYLLKNVIKPSKKSIPVIYNTWFYEFEKFNAKHLETQIQAAKSVGCEIFVIDAGWYGPGDGNWYEQAGWWQEKNNAAFYGKMSQFADKVRAAGMKFGLWMEPERIGRFAPILKEQPEWFLLSQSGMHYPDMENPAVYSYTLGEISRLVETYGLAWMKIDFNHIIGPDASGKELNGYYRKWYELMDEVREKYPHVFFEGCASGGLRLDAVSLSHFDAQFPSDTVEPADVLRITQGAALRLPVGRLTKWVTLRTINNLCPYDNNPDTPVTGLITAATATWNRSVSVDIDFVVIGAMLGGLGFSGDLAGLPEETLERIKQHVTFFKQWREFIAAGICHLLTPVSGINDRCGWAAFQLQSQSDDTSLLFVFRLKDFDNRHNVKLRGLSASGSYAVKRVNSHTTEEIQYNGGTLMTDGLTVEINNDYNAALFIIQPLK